MAQQSQDGRGRTPQQTQNELSETPGIPRPVETTRSHNHPSSRNNVDVKTIRECADYYSKGDPKRFIDNFNLLLSVNGYATLCVPNSIINDAYILYENSNVKMPPTQNSLCPNCCPPPPISTAPSTLSPSGNSHPITSTPQPPPTNSSLLNNLTSSSSSIPPSQLPPSTQTPSTQSGILPGNSTQLPPTTQDASTEILVDLFSPLPPITSCIIPPPNTEPIQPFIISPPSMPATNPQTNFGELVAMAYQNCKNTPATTPPLSSSSNTPPTDIITGQIPTTIAPTTTAQTTVSHPTTTQNHLPNSTHATQEITNPIYTSTTNTQTTTHNTNIRPIPTQPPITAAPTHFQTPITESDATPPYDPPCH